MTSLSEEFVHQIVLLKKVRRVRTPGGVKRFNAPIGTPIVADKVTGKLRALKPGSLTARSHKTPGRPRMRDNPARAGKKVNVSGRALAARRGSQRRLRTDDVNVAAAALAHGREVELTSTHEAVVLIDKLAGLVKEAEAKGDQAPSYNLCKVYVKGKNLFCAYHKGIPRVKMPQLAGVPIEGSKASKLPYGDQGGVDLTDEFRKHLESLGYKITDETVPAANLKATQNELKGPKVSAIAASIRKEGIRPGTRLFVSEDDYIIDGHHRWAAMVAVDLDDDILGNDMAMDVARVKGLDIITLLDLTNKFAADWGIPQVSAKRKQECGCL